MNALKSVARTQRVTDIYRWYAWYEALKAVVRCNDQFRPAGCYKRGTTREHTFTPPILFFINELLEELKQLNSGICIGYVKFESFARAEDVSLFISTVTGLQNLVDACYYYSKKWRFNLGIKQSKCIDIDIDIVYLVSGDFGPRLFRNGHFGRQSVISDGDFGRCVVKWDGDFGRCTVNSDAAVNSDGDFGRCAINSDAHLSSLLYHYFGTNTLISDGNFRQ